MNEWQQYYSRAQNTLSQIQNRLDAIIRYELPRYQNDLAAQESRRPTAVAELQSAEQSLANSSANFDRYLAATNYLNLEREANRTAGVVSQIQATIAEFQRGVANRQALIKLQTSIRDALIKRIADTNALIAQKQNRLVEVNAALAAYDAQKAEIQGRIDLAKTELKVFTDQYAASLN